MTTPRDPDEILAAWLDAGPTRLPDQTRRAIAVALPTTSQRRHAISVPRRFFTMSLLARMAAIAVLVALAGTGLVLFIGRSPSNEVAVPPVEPSSSATSAASPSPSLPSPTPVASKPTLPPPAALTGTFDSKVYAYSIGTPADMKTKAASEVWDGHTESLWDKPWVDHLYMPDYRFQLGTWATPVDTTLTVDGWAQAFAAVPGEPAASACEPSKWEPIDIGDQPGLFIHVQCADFWAVAVVDGVGYVWVMQSTAMDEPKYMGPYESNCRAMLGSVEWHHAPTSSRTPRP